MKDEMTEDVREIITDEEIEKVWGYADFGSISKRDVIANSLLKHACGWSTGHTASSILRELNLIGVNGSLKKRGRYYLFFAFKKHSL